LTNQDNYTIVSRSWRNNCRGIDPNVSASPWCIDKTSLWAYTKLNSQIYL